MFDNFFNGRFRTRQKGDDVQVRGLQLQMTRQLSGFWARNMFTGSCRTIPWWNNPLNSLDEKGHTPLHIAAAMGRISAAKELLGEARSGGNIRVELLGTACGASINAVDRRGHTPVDLAMIGGHHQESLMTRLKEQEEGAALRRQSLSEQSSLIDAVTEPHQDVGQQSNVDEAGIAAVTSAPEQEETKKIMNSKMVSYEQTTPLLQPLSLPSMKPNAAASLPDSAAAPKRVFPPGIVPPKGAMAGIGVQIEMKELEDEPGQCESLLREGQLTRGPCNCFLLHSSHTRHNLQLGIGTSVENQPLSTVIQVHSFCDVVMLKSHQAITGPQGSDVTLILYREGVPVTTRMLKGFDCFKQRIRLSRH
eukprot:756939-Hanusia_phi.AAC.1